MANITLQLEINTVWTDIKTDFPLVDGVTYVGDIVGENTYGNVFSADTDTVDAPTVDIIGHPFTGGEEITPENGVYTWVRTSLGTATFVATEI